jgi:hypothetical protein
MARWWQGVWSEFLIFGVLKNLYFSFHKTW